MSIRDYCRKIGFDVIGKLKRIPNPSYLPKYSSYPLYIDEGGNCYWRNDCGTWLIITADDSVY